MARTGGQRPGQRPHPQSPRPPAGRQLCPGELRAPCTSPNRRLCSDARLPSQLVTQGSGAPSPSSFRPGGPDPPALPPSDPGVQAPIPSPLRPGVQAISPSPFRPGGPDLQPRLPHTRGSRPPRPASLRPGGPDPPAPPPADLGVQAPIPSPLRPGVQAISPSPFRPRGPGPRPLLPQGPSLSLVFCRVFLRGGAMSPAHAFLPRGNMFDACGPLSGHSSRLRP